MAKIPSVIANLRPTIRLLLRIFYYFVSINYKSDVIYKFNRFNFVYIKEKYLKWIQVTQF